MAKVANKTGTPAEIPDEPKFRYSLELVATIALHFVDGNTNERAATDRAIHFLDTVSKTIERKMVSLRAQNERERLSQEIPKHLPFAKGIRWITGKRDETDATKAFREYVRLSLWLCDLGHPAQLTDEQAKELLQPSPDEITRNAEDSRIETLTAGYRNKGFYQPQLVLRKEEFEWLQTRLVRPYQNSERGKLGGRPRGSRKKSKKVLGADSKSQK